MRLPSWAQNGPAAHLGGSKPAAPGFLRNPSSFVSPSPFFHRAERRRPWRPEGRGAATAPPLASAGEERRRRNVAAWLPLSLYTTEWRRALGGVGRRHRRPPRRRARSPVWEGAAVERPGGGALCPKLARMSKARRRRLRCPCPRDGGCAPEIRRLCVVFPTRSRDSSNGGCGRGPRWVPPILFVLGLGFLSSFDLHRNYFLWFFRFMTESTFQFDLHTRSALMPLLEHFGSLGVDGVVE